MNAKKLAILVAVLCIPVGAGAQAISASATIELVDPFPGGWFPSENLDLYARVVNNGGQTIKVGADLVFEVEKNKDAVAHSHSGVVHLHTHGDTSYSSPYDDPFRQVPGHKDDIGVMVPPGHAYAISSTDYDPRFISSSPQRPVRAHYRIEEGRWLSSGWVEPKMLKGFPKFEGPPLFQYEIAQGLKVGVSIARIGEEDWLCTHVLGETNSPLTRICRAPKGVNPVSFHHDMKARRLAIRFDAGEPEMIWDSRNGVPLSGSERTVPHLHLWKKFSGRPFTRPYTGEEPKERFPLTFKLLPEEFDATSRSTPSSPTNPSVPPDEVNVFLVGPKAEERPSWLWILGGLLLIFALTGAGMRLRGRKA